MQYLVAIENSAYHHWQAELLIESFRLQKLEDSLVLAIADGGSTTGFARNISNQKNTFRYFNYGKSRGITGLNRAFAANAALSSGLIRQPFCLIEPDMVLNKPIELPKEKISVSVDWQYNEDFCRDNDVNINYYLTEISKRKWFCLGGVMVFTDVPVELFGRAIYWTERVEYDRILKSVREGNQKDVWKGSVGIGWTLAILECEGHLSIKNSKDYECHLVEYSKNVNFVHYSHGIPPFWSKRMYQFNNSGVTLGGNNPYKILLEHNPTWATNVLQNVVRSYIGSV